jgi:hypothetical protein
MDSALAKQWAEILELEAESRLLWDKVDRAKQRFIRMAKMGRKQKLVAPISESRGVLIVDCWRSAIRAKEEKIFTKAYCRRYDFKEVPLA